MLEQAYCRLKGSAEFAERGMNYRVDFGEAAEDYHHATQVNTRTGTLREVRRWPSKGYKDSHSEKIRAHNQAAWSVWLQADWGWVLLDPQETGTSSTTPLSRYPPTESYMLGPGVDGHCFPEPFWPDVLRCWPSQALKCAAHPMGRRCNFALQRLSCCEAGSPSAALEWGCLQGLWRQGGHNGELLAAYRIQNRGLLKEFTQMREAVSERLRGENFKDGAGREGQLSVKMLWHGTKRMPGLIDICSDGFDRAMASTCAFGKGCYFATSAVYSDKYACDIKVPGESRRLRAMILAAVIVGETVQGTANLYPPPVKPHSRTGERYENAVDKVTSPSIMVTFKDNQALPAYVMIYGAP